MCLTKDVDLKLLHKCFQLETFDNLLKPHFMDAVRARRDHLAAQEKRRMENLQIEAERKFKTQTMRSNIIAQRIELQEHLMGRSDEILKTIDELLSNEEEAKEKLSKEYVVEELFGNWLTGFTIYQPSDFFMNHGTHN